MWFCIGNNSCVEELNVRLPASPPSEDILSILTNKSSRTILKLIDGKEYSTQQITSKLGLLYFQNVER